MALVVNNEVALINGTTVSSPDAFIRRGDILFGIVTAVTAGPDTASVLWENGQFTASIPVAAAGPLDLIVAAATSEADDFQGKVVYPLPTSGSQSVQSPEYRCIVVRVYRRQRFGAGDIQTYLLLRNISTGEMFEAISTTVTVIPGQ